MPVRSTNLVFGNNGRERANSACSRYGSGLFGCIFSLAFISFFFLPLSGMDGRV